MNFYAPCPPGAEEALMGELDSIGAGAIRKASRGVSFSGDLNTAYRAGLETRTASRILLELCRGPAADEEDLNRLVNNHPWEDEFDPRQTIACRVTGVPSDRDPRYATLKVKDGIVDRLKAKKGSRPDVDRRNPDIRIEARWDGRTATVYINWSGPPLHERGYRLERTDAVLRETTAAAILAMAGWGQIASEGGAFVDPVCGSGTLLAEAAMMAVDAPVGSLRKSWGFTALKRHREEQWNGLFNDARIRFGESLERMPPIYGYDIDESALRTARANLRRAGLSRAVRLERHDITGGRPESWPASPVGLLCADPPYGVRMESDPSEVYAGLGNMFRTLDVDWKMALLAPDRKTASASCLRADGYRYTVSGGMDLILALYTRIGAPKKTVETGSGTEGRDGTGRPERAAGTDSAAKPDRPAKPARPDKPAKPDRPAPDPKAPSVRKALERNLKALGPWAEKTGVSSYRIWDSDMPEFNAAVDWYEGRWLMVQEFAAPGKVAPEKSRRRLLTLLDILMELTGCPEENIFLKTRQRGIRPYVKLGFTKDRFIIRENGRRFLVNLNDYLDSGIFLDHRPTRAMIAAKSKGGDFLNLFCYTGAASVMAAAGGARKTVSVDVSNTYLDWARDNLKLNNLDGASNTFVRSDAFEYLRREKGLFDLIFIDPPTYSNGAGRDDWSVQDNHADLITLAMKRLKPEGTILFSENFRRFVLDSGLKKSFTLREITRETMPPDFARRGKAHRCWEIRHSP